MGATPDNTAALLQRMLQRDGTAWDELTREYSGFLLAIVRRTFAAYSIRTTSQDHEDAVADVWKNLLENDGRVVRQCIERGNFLQTLQVLARNRSIDLMRKRQSQVVPLVESYTAAAPPPEESLSAIYPPEKVAAAVAALPPREKSLVNLFFLQGKKYREIAAITGIPQNSIGPTLARAVARLRKSLDS